MEELMRRIDLNSNSSDEDDTDDESQWSEDDSCMDMHYASDESYERKGKFAKPESS